MTRRKRVTTRSVGGTGEGTTAGRQGRATEINAGAASGTTAVSAATPSAVLRFWGATAAWSCAVKDRLHVLAWNWCRPSDLAGPASAERPQQGLRSRPAVPAGRDEQQLVPEC